MLVDTQTQERAEVVTGAAGEPGRAEVFVRVRPTNEIAGCRVPLRQRRRCGVVKVILILARGVLRRRNEEIARGRGAVLL